MVVMAIGVMLLWGWSEPIGGCEPGSLMTGCRVGDGIPTSRLHVGLLRFLLVSAASILAVSAAGLLWRRRRGGSAKWIRVAATSVTAGTLAGCVASRMVADSAMAAAFVTTAVTSMAMAVAWVALIRPVLAEPPKTVGTDR